jgi:hypothetical protein
MADGDKVTLGSEDNLATNRTSLTKTAGFLPVLDLFNDHGVGLLIISGESSFHGGEISTGEALAAFSPGVAINANGDETGVFSSGNQTGVMAISDSGVGVDSSSESGVAVSAFSESGTGLGTFSNSGIGVQAVSIKDYAVQGIAGSGTGILGFSWLGDAGRFYGPVNVFGDFTVIGGSKSAAVPYPDGSYRRLYTLESPDCWFEDFGRAQLKRGKATVKLQPDFARVIDGKDLHIFLSPEGDCNGVYVSSKNAKSFSVRELNGGLSTLSFSYRIVGRRKDISCQRMKKISLPKRPPITQAAPTAPKRKRFKARDISFYKKKTNK